MIENTPASADKSLCCNPGERSTLLFFFLLLVVLFRGPMYGLFNNDTELLFFFLLLVILFGSPYFIFF